MLRHCAHCGRPAQATEDGLPICEYCALIVADLRETADWWREVCRRWAEERERQEAGR